MKIVTYVHQCHVEDGPSGKVLVVSPEKQRDLEGEQFADNDAIGKTQEVAKFNDAARSLALKAKRVGDPATALKLQYIE